LGIDTLPTIWLDDGMTTTTCKIRYRRSSELRLGWLRMERHAMQPEEMVAELLNPQYGWGVDIYSVPPTPEQWRQIGLTNGLAFR
jgi:hypothetical protein